MRVVPVVMPYRLAFTSALTVYTPNSHMLLYGRSFQRLFAQPFCTRPKYLETECARQMQYGLVSRVGGRVVRPSLRGVLHDLLRLRALATRAAAAGVMTMTRERAVRLCS